MRGASRCRDYRSRIKDDLFAVGTVAALRDNHGHDHVPNLHTSGDIIADASEADHELVASLGADIVVRRGDDVATRILEYFPNGVDGLADGAVLNALVIPAVRDGGAFTSVRGFKGEPQRGIKFTTTSVRTYDGEFEKLDHLRQLVESGAITLRVADTYPPERAGDAHRRLETGGTRGRLVIEF